MFKKLLVLGALALAIGATVRTVQVPTPGGAALFSFPLFQPRFASAEPENRWQPMWSIPTSRLQDMALAPDGSSVAWLDEEGAVSRLLGDDGSVLWKTPAYPGLDRVRINQQGTVIAFPLNTGARSTVRLLHPEYGAGRTALVSLHGSIRTAEITPDGKTALLGMEPGRIYQLPMQSEAAQPAVPRPLNDTLISLTSRLDADGQPVVYCSTRRGETLAWVSSPTEQPVWHETGKQGEPPMQVQTARIGDVMVCVQESGPQSPSPKIALREASTGRVLWSRTLSGFDPQVTLSDNGRYLAVTYSRPATPGSPVIERKLLVLDWQGNPLFPERGGVTFAPELVGFSAGGSCLTVRDPQGNLWLLNQRGQTLARMAPPRDEQGKPMRLHRTSLNPSGDYLLLHYSAEPKVAPASSAGRLCLYRFRGNGSQEP
ncbi:MAG: hypothetical protein OHK0029_23940 [Armatimonadaceae bacterium]